MRDLFRDTFLGFVRVHLLHHAAREPIFGTEMIEELRRHGYALSPGTLYPMLHALEAEGYLRSEAQVTEGKVRRYYRSTAAGRKALERLKVKIRELVDEVLEDGMPAKRPAPLVTPARTAAARPRTGRDPLRSATPRRTVKKAAGRRRGAG
jgi:PadR family transcriptional regulator, regulatory protein PadR